MDIILNHVEVRILGSLIEKQITTPDYYPISLNTLTNACNQKSNRNPVVLFEDTVVVRGLDSLQNKGLSEKIYKADSRVPKYQHIFDKKYNLSLREVAILCELMLRGPQTMGELRSRCERMYRFRDLQEVEEVLDSFIARDEPMAVKLPRQAGRKENRYMHLFSGEPEITDEGPPLMDETATLRVRAENERLDKIEEELAALRKAFDELVSEYQTFKSQFE